METLVIPILMKLKTDEVEVDEERDRLELVRRDDGMYIASSGIVYGLVKWNLARVSTIRRSK